MRLAGFAADRPSYIKRRLGLAPDDELAQVNVIKLAEERGEAANACLALRGLQRDAKLNGSTDERLEAMAKEIGDVVATAAVLAHALGLNVDDVIAQRMRQLSERRERWMEAHADGSAGAHATVGVESARGRVEAGSSDRRGLNGLIGSPTGGRDGQGPAGEGESKGCSRSRMSSSSRWPRSHSGRQ